jgi:hypothetical protein
MIKLERLEYGPNTVYYFASDKISYNGFIVNACEIKNLNSSVLKECTHLGFAKLKNKPVCLEQHSSGMYFYTPW